MGINIGTEEIRSKNFWIAVAAEFEATLIFLVCCTTVAIGWGSNGTSANNVEIGIGIGLAIASLAQAFGHVSGGHINPAVSLGLALAGRVSVIRAVFYTVAQVLGAVAGSAITLACTNSKNRGGMGAVGLGPNVSPVQGFICEAIFTFFLVFFVISITDPRKTVEAYGTTLGIGVMILVAHVCIIPFTGCGINPARAFGPAVVTNAFNAHWIYWVGPILGAIVAALQYTFLFGVPEDENSRNEERIQLSTREDA